MKVHELGHVVLRVRDLDRSLAFYGDLLGMKVVARMMLRGARMAFFSLGHKHHDLALLEVGASAEGSPPDGVGLYHVALKVGDSLDELRAVDRHLRGRGIVPLRYVDHRVSQSIYLADPDGIVLELYVDSDPKIWAEDPTAVAHAEPLSLA